MKSTANPGERSIPDPSDPDDVLLRETDARAIDRARSSIAVFAGLLIVIACATATGLPATLSGIVNGWTSREWFREASVRAYVFVGVVATWIGLRRWPRAALGSCGIVIVFALAALIANVPVGEWFARERDIGDWTILFVAALVFAPLIGFGLRRGSPWLIGIGGFFTFQAVIWMFVISAHAAAVAVGIALLVGSMLAWSRVQRAWPSIRRHPDWFFQKGRRRRRVGEVTLESHAVDPGLRASSGIARSYLRWKRLTRPSIRSGGVGGLGIH